MGSRCCRRVGRTELITDNLVDTFDVPLLTTTICCSIANLIENAIRHCPPGSRITLAAAAESDKAFSISVTDTGPGIPAAERDRVFQRLYRLDKSRSTPGHGLGLSLVKAIAELHGVRIDIGDNNPGLHITVQFMPQSGVTFES